MKYTAKKYILKMFAWDGKNVGCTFCNLQLFLLLHEITKIISFRTLFSISSTARFWIKRSSWYTSSAFLEAYIHGVTSEKKVFYFH